LTLKTLAGFGVPEIARAFLTSEATVAQRIVRAKRTIRERGIAYEVPEGADLEHRIDSVLNVLYLFFNEGYNTHQGADLVRQDLCAEAIRLTSILASRPVGDQPRVHALLALMLLQASRLPARVDDNGDLLLLEQQDRRLWDQRMIVAGFMALDRAAAGDRLSTYHLQAGIAAEHAVASSVEDTNWQRILDYYSDLVRLTGSPVSKLNRVVALAKVEGPLAGLRSLDTLLHEPALEHYYLLHATAGELQRQSGQYPAAQDSFSRALVLAGNDAEHRFLQQRLRECTNPAG
jgi:predicted RNA polymerase sigma factor